MTSNHTGESKKGQAWRGSLLLLVVLAVISGVAAVSSGARVASWVRPDPADVPRRLAETLLDRIAHSDLPRACGTVLPDGGLVNPCVEGLEARSDELRQIRELGPDITVTGVKILGDKAEVTAALIEPRPPSSLSVSLERSGDSWRVSHLNDVAITW